MARINICLPALQAGGAEKVLLMLAEHFLAEGYEVRFLLIQDKVDLDVPPGASVLCLGGATNAPFVWSVLIAFFALRSLFRKCGQQDRFLVSLTGTSLLLLLAKRLWRSTAYILVREAATLATRKSRSLHFLIRWLYPHADRIVGVSDDVRSSLKALLGQDAEVVVQNNPVDAERLRALARAETSGSHKIRSGVRAVVAVGRLVPEKGLDDLLKACAVVLPATDSRLVIVGDGPLRQSLETQAEALGILDRVLFLGYQKNPYTWMSRAEVFVLPSRSEGFANVVLEAIAVGVPKLVVTNCPGGPAGILQDHPSAWVVPCGEVSELAQALSTALVSPGLIYDSSRILRRLSPSAVARRYLDLLGL